MATRPGYIWSGTEWVSIGQEAVETPFSYQATAPTSPSTGDIWVDSDAVVSGVNTNDFLLKADVPTTPVYKMNTGSTTERPTGANGLFRFNTTTGYPEWYDELSSSWWNFYQVKPLSVEYLVAAGGGSTPTVGSITGGGGAGGLLTGSLTLTASTNYTVTVGAGGSPNATAPNSVFSSITCIGGGEGGRNSTGNTGKSGGSGGGGYTAVAGGAGTAGQGYAGAPGNSSEASGGGGGAGGTPATPSPAYGGNGGVGLQSSITGIATYYSGGGAGSGYTQPGGTGGLGGGGNGNRYNPGGGGTAGTANTGGGAGGGGYSGGSGIVILAYPSYHPSLTVSAGLTYTVDTTNRSGYKVYKFTAGTGTVSF